MALVMTANTRSGTVMNQNSVTLFSAIFASHKKCAKALIFFCRIPEKDPLELTHVASESKPLAANTRPNSLRRERGPNLNQGPGLDDR